MGLSFGSAQEISQKLCTNALHYDPVEYDKTGAGRGRQPSTFYGFPLEDTALLQSETTDLSCRWRLRGALRSFHWHFVWWGGRIGRRCGWVKLTGTNPRGRAAEMGHRIGFRFSRWRREPTTEAMWLMEFLSNEFIRNIIKKEKKNIFVLSIAYHGHMHMLWEMEGECTKFWIFVSSQKFSDPHVHACMVFD